MYGHFGVFKHVQAPQHQYIVPKIMELNTMETNKYQLPFSNNHLDILDSQ
jgi:hypothetical protein